MLTRKIPLISSSLALLFSISLPAQDANRGPAALDPSELKVADGFEVELVYTVPKEAQGSWVALAVDASGRMIAADQYGKLYRFKPNPIGGGSVDDVEPIDIRLPALSDSVPESDMGAHGLLCAFDSLYVMVNEVDGKQGVWRLRDTDGDDRYDSTEYVLIFDGQGEHGPHSMVLSPDGKSIYFSNGNHTELPVALERTRPVEWGEDHLLPRMWDARGHAKGKYAPGGYIGRFDPDGSNVELFAIGFRNEFDLAFDQNGELFTYDSDMEWDQGAPWYRPTRINHVVSGGDYGWRSGTGKWPAYYPDSLPAAVDIGPGSPTGMTFGTEADFPARYRNALFAADWTYGTLYAIHLDSDGATFAGEREEFVTGKPLPITDIVVNPSDGALYFAIGGRRTQSALYRVYYAGSKEPKPSRAPEPTSEAVLRRSLEAYHEPHQGLEAVEAAWPHLGHEDRFVRYAARVALEHQPTAGWADRALGESQPRAAIEALVALARVGAKRYQPEIIDSLLRFDLSSLPDDLRLPYLRAWQLVFTRLGDPDGATKARAAKMFESHFPASDAFVNRELVSLLVYLDSPTIVAKAVPLLKVEEPKVKTPEAIGGEALIARNDYYGRTVKSVGEHRPDRQQIAYAFALQYATEGWTPELKTEYFSWFPTTREWKGGASFSGFIQNIRSDALARIARPHERDRLVEVSKIPTHSLVEGAIAPKGPGRIYGVEEATRLVEGSLVGRDFERGEAMYRSTACVSCHSIAGFGSGIGPDLTGAGNRYSVGDLLENIIEPSKVISDQYGSEIFERNGETVMIGRVVGEEQGRYIVMTNPFAPDATRSIPIEGTTRRENPISLMPPGLLNALNPDELRDLVAYLLSGADREDAMFKK